MSRTRSPTDAPLFDRLPDTIVSDIFELTWRNWKCDSSSLWGGIGRFSVPYILASVSRRWRTIALSTSRIWRFVELPRRPELIEDHLARSRSLPLDIDIGLVWTEDGDKVEDRGADIQESLRILMETNSWARIEELHSRLNHKQTSLLLADFNATIEANPVSTVQMINIQPHYTDYGDDDDPIEMFLRIPHSQSLCWVNLESVAVSPIPHLPSSPLLGLEQLEIKDTDVQLSDSLLPLLDLTPNLADLLIEGCQLLPGMLTAAKPRPRHSLLLSNLETLSLDCTGITGLNMLFQTLDMPDLKHLSITRVDRGTNIDWDAICHCHAVEFLIKILLLWLQFALDSA
ncbi:hypothetical protein FRC12_015669 [Ceratobasidium sp. 428]|nr:hypothetical protein FRC12_015669 [Ceratobasidium sp. 428]